MNQERHQEMAVDVNIERESLTAAQWIVRSSRNADLIARLQGRLTDEIWEAFLTGNKFGKRWVSEVADGTDVRRFLRIWEQAPTARECFLECARRSPSLKRLIGRVELIEDLRVADYLADAVLEEPFCDGFRNGAGALADDIRFERRRS